MTTRTTRGFTVIELLVVICILTILMAIVGSIIVDVINRARYSKTVGLIRVLHEGCERYKTEDLSRKFPSPGGNDAAGSTAILHLRLGKERDVYKQIGMAPVKAKPLVEFKLDWLEGPPPNIDPGASGTNIWDAWKIQLRYKDNSSAHIFSAKTGIPFANSVAIRSFGADGADNAGNGDDAGNWERVGTTN